MVNTIPYYVFHKQRLSSTIFNLLHLLYFFLQQLLFNILGAVEAGRKHHCTPLQSLDGKEFSTGFWTWWNSTLQDAGRQFGFPHVFITVSPTEWYFPQVCNFVSITTFVYNYNFNDNFHSA